ncbi:aromatic ring-hydroxylating oxygenase subunit alpha [Falsiroseomonas stagni]|uniref:Phenylpropionate dioxygenase, large terminal subunit n=1 Tax=Falsiroseomonas stagni DSM 19981 TaxID=1123062 RepID=A0A1I4CUM6_9PROT|nr:aromatic ring-hydroxylating dioxygenase subunit alpha [Falsiroseomonas stagni]SFK84320.1 Phenylpropionate dioxygenase, large terminal subunit [Falsiroseomonas stagni DSM 19981]
MKVGDAPVFRKFWYVAMPVAKLKAGPQPFSLFGEDMVIWQAADGTVSALRDECCHRAAKLSLGEIIGDSIRCPYHGWAFGADGHCTSIPQRPGLTPEIAARAFVKKYRVQVRYDYVWVAVEEPLMDIPHLPEFGAAGFRFIDCFHEEWDMSLFRLADNFFDLAHVAFVHRETQGDIKNPVPPAEDVEETEFGIISRSIVPVANRQVGQDYTGIKETTTVRDRTATWWAPCTRKLHIRFPNGVQHIIFTAGTPLADKKIIFTQFCIRNDTEEQVPAAAAIAHDRKVTSEDRFILESTRADVPIMPWETPEAGMPADKANNMARKKLREIVERYSDPAAAAVPSKAA